MFRASPTHYTPSQGQHLLQGQPLAWHLFNSRRAVLLPSSHPLQINEGVDFGTAQCAPLTGSSSGFCCV